MGNKQSIERTTEDLQKEIRELKYHLEEANETIEAIRTGQVDAIVVQGHHGHQLYTLKSADQTYRFFIERMTEGAVTLNSDGLILYSNSRFAKMVNLPLSRVIGLPFIDFIAEEDTLQFSTIFKNSWHGDSKGEVFIISGNNKIPVQLSLTVLELDDGISLSIILTDLTLQKASQSQLRQKNKELQTAINDLEASNHDLQQFASVASHDLQEPLRKIQVYTYLLKDKQNEFTDESRIYLEKVINSSRRLQNLIIDILNYSRLSADTPREKINLNELIRELKEDYELLIQEKSARFIVDELPVIEINRGQIRQVFQNIISNALKFSKPGLSPLIKIKSRIISEKSFNAKKKPEGNYCLITIQDNGIGFDEQYSQNIFTLFTRLHAKDKYEGTGIGLAITKKIIEKHNGMISAISRVGKGTEFRIILPIANNQY